MKKKIIVKSSVVAVLVLLVAIIFAINKREDLFPMFSYTTEHSITTLADEDKLDENLPTVVFFHTKMCSACISFRPHFNQLKKDYKGKYNFAELDIQDSANYPISITHGSSVPNLYIFDPSIGNKIHISLADVGSYNGLKFELDRYLRMRSFLDMEKAKAEHERLFNEYQEKLAKAQKNKR